MPGMCSGWLVLSPFVGVLLAAWLWESEWARHRDIGESWILAGFFVGMAFMWVYLVTFCGSVQ
jgi:hypothetical protein